MDQQSTKSMSGTLSTLYVLGGVMYQICIPKSTYIWIYYFWVTSGDGKHINFLYQEKVLN